MKDNLSYEEIEFLQKLVSSKADEIPEFSGKKSLLHELALLPIGVKVTLEITTPVRLLMKTTINLPATVEELVQRTGLEEELLKYILTKYKRFSFNDATGKWEKTKFAGETE